MNATWYKFVAFLNAEGRGVRAKERRDFLSFIIDVEVLQISRSW